MSFLHTVQYHPAGIVFPEQAEGILPRADRPVENYALASQFSIAIRISSSVARAQSAWRLCEASR